jgi:glycerol uptake facilitator-like aquaporin
MSCDKASFLAGGLARCVKILHLHEIHMELCLQFIKNRICVFINLRLKELGIQLWCQFLDYKSLWTALDASTPNHSWSNTRQISYITMTSQLSRHSSLHNVIEKVQDFKFQGIEEDSAPIRRWRTNMSSAHNGCHNSNVNPVEINSQPFVGRVGGNQLHAVPKSDPDYEAIQKTNPDAVQSPKWSSILSLQPFKDIHIWRNACLEGVGLCIWVFIAGLVAHGTAPLATATSLGVIVPVTIAAIVQFLIVSLFIFSLGPVTGAHLTPLITFATFLAKLTSLPRMVLYIVFQCIGSIVGSYILRAALGGDPSVLEMMPGCYIDPDRVSGDQAFALETMGALYVLFLAFGLGLDPRNQGSFGAGVGPFLVGLSSAIGLVAGAIPVPGYYGTSCNPARCLGLMAASHRFTFHWVHWTGDLTACVVHAFIYYAVPPFCNQRIQD